MKRIKLALVATSLGLAAVASSFAWGQPEHAVLGETVLRKASAALPPELSAPETRGTYVYGCFSPDGFLFHGPTYVHLDRQFAVFMLNRARDARGVAAAYGWASHMEQDAAGHGRYIKESGLTHLIKEVACGTRVRYQGADWEKDTIRGLRAVFDADQIHQASVDYATTYGAEYDVISKRHARLTGTGYAAYLTALKGIMFANYYGNLKWRPQKYPRSEFQPALTEAAGLTENWCRDFRSFSRSTAESLKSALFGHLEELLAEPPLGAPGPLEAVPSERAAHEVREAVQEIMELRRAAPRPPLFAHHDFQEARGDLPDSHVLVQDPAFYELGASLATSSAVQMVEHTDGSFYSIEPVITDEELLVRDMLEVLEGQGGVGFFAEGGLAGDRGEFYQQLREVTRKAVEAMDGGGEDR